ncbi:hypothetical protein B0H17DRAFT_1197835 [Mycena rosella]|uniref:Endonuclease/exonuclease/phosphatase domain-containing protein n=1 Tax=Mycena rosella TaxID=1033263 RepID=A0AAD7DQF3_MYCRO|nr:hypothetical protein B0H17DRAFT_1197835 [Mycena rosella]
MARSRSNGGRMRRPYGGVAVVMKASIRFKIIEEISGPDLIALELEKLYLIGTYLLPAGTPWGDWSEVDPQTRFSEALAWFAVNRSKPIAALADFNSQTGDESPLSSVLTRVSSDEKDNRMDILNGTLIEGSSPGAYTSFQPNGDAVVDYALFSPDFLHMVPASSLQITRVDDWSDHAILTLCVVMPTHQPEATFPSAPSLPLQSPARPISPTECDILALETIAAGQTD